MFCILQAVDEVEEEADKEYAVAHGVPSKDENVARVDHGRDDDDLWENEEHEGKDYVRYNDRITTEL